MRTNWKYVSLLGLLWSASAARADTRVFFDKDEYVVSAVGESFDVQILLDADDRTPDLDPVRTGLYSFGAQVTFDPTKAELSGPAAVSTVSPLDYFGFLPGALTEASAGLAGSKGNIDQFQNPLVTYDGALLMTLTITNKSPAVDMYPLQLDFFRTLGATEQLFLSGDGSVLDGDIVFGDAVVRVVPEPSTAGLLALGLLPLWRAVRKRGVASGGVAPQPSPTAHPRADARRARCILSPRRGTGGRRPLRPDTSLLIRRALTPPQAAAEGSRIQVDPVANRVGPQAGSGGTSK